MEKLAYLVWDDDDDERSDAARDGFRDRLLGELPGALGRASAERLKVCVTDEAVSSGASLHLGAHAPDALVTFWLECCQDRGPAEAALDAIVARHAGYLVAESHPLRIDSPAGDLGQRMPGFTLVGCIEPIDGISRHDFMRQWESVHRDVAIDVQSTFSYVRNEVVRPLTEGAPDWWGIVEEGFPTEALTTPHAFYDAVGDDAKFRRNLKAMMDSCNAFLSVKKVDSHPMSEYRFF
jgi:hypothetical protein